jgi:hypothetical protein
VQLTFKVREAKTHLEFSGKVKWNGVFEDEMGQKIPGQGVEIDHYEGQWGYCDVSGNWLADDTEDGAPRIRRFHKKSVKGVRVTNATIVSGTTAEFTTKKAHGFVVDEVVRVQDVKPNAYNGKWTVLAAGLTTTKFRADISASPADLENEGTVEGQPDPNYNFVIEHFSRPKIWYVTTRVRAWDDKNCPSDWSSWTNPALPWTGADPKPPIPANLDLDFEDVEKGRFERWVAFLEFDEVLNFDYPGTPADDEDDLSRYAAQLQVSQDGSTAVGRTRRKTVEAKDEDADTRAHIKFGRIKGSRYYRGRVRSIDRFNRRGDWSAWTPWQKPGQEVPPSPLLVTIKEDTKDRVVLDWDTPTEPGDEDEINEEIEHFQVQIATAASFGPSVRYAWDKRVTGTKKSIHIRKADQDGTFYGRVRSVSADGVKGTWIPATINGNSNPGATADGITLERDKIIETFTLPSPLVVGHFDRLWTAEHDYKFKRVKVRFGRHDPATHPSDGCPQGSAAILQVFWHNEDETSQAKLFALDDRLSVAANTHKDVGWAEDLLVTAIAKNEHLSVKCTQIGSTVAGSGGIVQVVMVPS